MTRLEFPRRRPSVVVLWGGRPGIDLQAGSPDDLARAEYLRRIARLRRAATDALVAYRRAFVRFGVTAAEATVGLRRAASALDRIGRNAQHRATTGAGLVRREPPRG
jgi:hypothetical protein